LTEEEETEEEHPGQWLYEEGKAYRYGLDLNNIDMERGQLMMEASASAGFPVAVAVCHYLGWNGLEKDRKKAFEMHLKIEKETNGDHWTQNMLDDCYDFGHVTDQDYNKAFEFYTKSAEQGNSTAMNNLGFCYHNGHACDQNDTKAFEWYEKSAQLGNSSAMNNLLVSAMKMENE